MKEIENKEEIENKMAEEAERKKKEEKEERIRKKKLEEKWKRDEAEIVRKKMAEKIEKKPSLMSKGEKMDLSGWKNIWWVEKVVGWLIVWLASCDGGLGGWLIGWLFD